MARTIQPIAKRCKKLDISPANMGYSKKITIRNPRANTRRKQSEYALQLNEKQKVKFVYGIMEKQFRKYYEEAARLPGKTGDNLLVLIERRLDNVVFRLGFAGTRPEARQMVSHGHITVDGHKCNIPSFIVKPGMKIALKSKSRSNEHFKEVLEANAGFPIPRWLEMDRETAQAQVMALPTREDFDMPIEEHLIVELYSK